MTEPTRIRLNIVSEVALEAGQPRPIHMFRPGTFTDMSGKETTFSHEDVTTIVARFSANRRRKPPITERHDFGRAIGRLQDIWADVDGNLYGMPKWNAEGRKLLEDEIYDGFSCELEPTDSGWALIGGSLTNYPAVGGLEPVTLAAPPLTEAAQETLRRVDELAETLVRGLEETQVLDTPPTVSLPRTPNLHPNTAQMSADFDAPLDFTAPPAPMSQARQSDIQHSTTKEFNTMSEDIQVEEGAQTPTLPPIQVPTFSAADPAVTAQVNAVVQQMTAQFEAQRQIVLEQAQAQFQRQLAEMQAQQQIQTYAQHITTPTMQRQHALPLEASAVVAFLSGLNATQRTTAEGLFNRILDAGLVSFEEIGSEGDGDRDVATDWNGAVNAKVALGMSRSAAIEAVKKEQPALFTEYNASGATRKGGR